MKVLLVERCAHLLRVTSSALRRTAPLRSRSQVCTRFVEQLCDVNTNVCQFIRVTFLRQNGLVKSFSAKEESLSLDLLFACSSVLRRCHSELTRNVGGEDNDVWRLVLRNISSVALCCLSKGRIVKSESSARVLKEILGSISLCMAIVMAQDLDLAHSLLSVGLSVMQQVKPSDGDTASLLESAVKLLATPEVSPSCASLCCGVIAFAYRCCPPTISTPFDHYSTISAVLDSLRETLRSESQLSLEALRARVETCLSIASVPAAIPVLLSSGLVKACIDVSQAISESESHGAESWKVHCAVIRVLGVSVSRIRQSERQSYSSLLGEVDEFVARNLAIFQELLASFVDFVHLHTESCDSALTDEDRRLCAAARDAVVLLSGLLALSTTAQECSLQLPNSTDLSYRVCVAVMPAVVNCIYMRRTHAVDADKKHPDLSDFAGFLLDFISASLSLCALLSPSVALLSAVEKKGLSKLSPSDVTLWDTVWSRWNPLFYPPDDAHQEENSEEASSQSSLWPLWRLQNCCAGVLQNAPDRVAQHLFFPKSRFVGSKGDPSDTALRARLVAVVEKVFVVIVTHTLFYRLAAHAGRPLVVASGATPMQTYPVSAAQDHVDAVRKRIADIASSVDGVRESGSQQTLMEFLASACA
jgi:hypothetical protein